MNLVVVRPYPYGGGDNLALLESLHRYSRLPEVTFLHTQGDVRDWQFLDGGKIRPVRCPEHHVRIGANLLQWMDGLAPWVRSGAVVDVAEAGNGYSAQVVRVARRARVPTIVTVLETRAGRVWDTVPPFSLYLRYVLRHASVFRVLTERSAAYLRGLGVPSERIVRIPIGIDTQLFHPRAEPTSHAGPRLLFARRLEPKNGIQILLEILPGLAERFPGLSLTVAGDGPSRGLVEAASAELPVQYVGRLAYPKLAELYRAVDIYCNPAMDTLRLGRVAQEDGQYSFPLLESQASGLAVVSSDSGANRELLSKGNRLVHQGDGRELEQAIAGLVAGPSRDSISSENRAWVEHQFSAGRWQPVFDELVERFGR